VLHIDNSSLLLLQQVGEQAALALPARLSMCSTGLELVAWQGPQVLQS
jgi:hypothetical protein